MRILLVLGIVGALFLGACQSDPGDPVAVSRQLIVALWTGDSKRVQALSCPGTEWSVEGDPSLTIDTDHMRFEVLSKAKGRAEVAVSGVVTFKGAEGQSEVRNLDDIGITRFALEDHKGWKVCDIR